MIEIDAPQTSINEDNVYKSDVTAIAAITSIYATMSQFGDIAGFTGNMGISLLLGLSADELTLYSGVSDNRLNAYYRNALVSIPSQNYGSEFWPLLYGYIFRCNAAIEGLNSTGSLTPSVKQQLLGEAKFMRAFFYFYLVSLFANVPLSLTTDPAVNAVLPQNTKQEIVQQIISDLSDAQNLLSTDYLTGSLLKYSGVEEKVRPVKWAATALLARVYLYSQDYKDSEMEATAVIEQTGLFRLDSLNLAFLKNSDEAIWQLQPVISNHNTEDAFTFILPATGPTSSANLNPVYLSDQLVNSFEANDQRRTSWIDSVVVGGKIYYYPYKYKVTATSGSPTEYLMVLRLAEQYLIRAEARAQQNKIPEAQSDVNAIRNRARLPATTANDKASLLTAILNERRAELFTEFGHRWLDLKRTGSVDTVMKRITPLKGGSWNTDWQLYPLPFGDVQRNQKLKQNAGY